MHRAAFEGGGGARELGEEEGMKRGEPREEIIPCDGSAVAPAGFRVRHVHESDNLRQQRRERERRRVANLRERCVG